MIGGRILDTSALVQAARGTPWAKKFVADSHGTHVQKGVKKKIGKPRKGGY